MRSKPNLKIRLGHPYDIDDDGKLKRRWNNKKTNAKKEGLECDLTFYDYCCLVRNAGLKSSDLGFTGKCYVLARYNDKGNYTVNNCRFITQYDNSKEKVLTEKSRNSSRENVKKAISANSKLSKEELSTRIKRGIQNSEYYKKRIEQSRINEEIRQSKLDPRRSGKNNPSYGTYWITNGIDNLKWDDTKGNIPEGYYKGRTCK